METPHTARAISPAHLLDPALRKHLERHPFARAHNLHYMMHTMQLAVIDPECVAGMAYGGRVHWRKIPASILRNVGAILGMWESLPECPAPHAWPKP